MKFKLNRKLRGVNQNNTSNSSEQDDDPLFYCSLCSKFLRYSDLIDGIMCDSCNNDLFLIPWVEIKDIPRSFAKRKTIVGTGKYDIF